MSNGNPFYIEPAKWDFGSLGKGLGHVIKSAKAKRKREEMVDILKSDDPARIKDFMIENPQLKDEFDDTFGYTNEMTKEIATNSYVNALSTLEAGKRDDGSYDPAAVKQAEEVMQQGVEGVTRFGGRPVFMQQDLDAIGEDPARMVNAVRTGLLITNPDAYDSVYGAAGKDSFSMGSQEMFKDDVGNIFFGAAIGDRRRGTLEAKTTPLVPGTEPVGKLTPAGGAYGQTAQENLETATEKYRLQQDEKSRSTLIDNYRQQSSASITELRELDNIINAIDSGADTGVFVNYFPTTTRATAELFQAARRLGLNIIQNTTFGALSAAEMKLAMETAVPTGLDEAGLRVWATNKKEKIYKLQNEINSAISHIEAGGSVQDWTAQRTRVRQAADQGINVGAKRRNKTTGQVEEWRDDGEWHPIPTQ